MLHRLRALQNIFTTPISTAQRGLSMSSGNSITLYTAYGPFMTRLTEEERPMDIKSQFFWRNWV